MTRWAPHTLRYAAAREIARSALGRGWFGALAREVGLEHLLDRHWSEPDAVELAVFRAHHAAAVRHASPLALDLLAHLDFDVDGLVDAIRPNGTQSRWICGSLDACFAVRPASPRALATASSAAQDASASLFLYGGIRLRNWDDPRGALGIRLSPAGLEIGARLGGVHLRTLAGVATLTIGAEVPHAVRIAALGRRVEEVFGHPVFEGRGYLIHWSGDYEGGAALGQEAPPWRVRFRAEPVPWRVPWARSVGCAADSPVPAWRGEIER